MWLVLCAAGDLAALWAARGLVARGLQPLEIITGEALAYSSRFTHRLTAGQPSVNIVLADGRVIDSATVHGTLNRLQLIPSAHLSSAGDIDRQYAEQELYALYLSWLHGLPGKMLNRPQPQGLCGEWRHPSNWTRLAAQAGLSILPYQQSERRAAPMPDALARNSTHTLIVAVESCCGPPAPPAVADACVRLARLSATPLLGIDFQVTPAGAWIFTNATPLPDLRLGGTSLLEALAETMRS